MTVHISGPARWYGTIARHQLKASLQWLILLMSTSSMIAPLRLSAAEATFAYSQFIRQLDRLINQVAAVCGLQAFQAD